MYEGAWLTFYQALEYYSRVQDDDPLVLTVAYLDDWGCDRKTLSELMRVDNLPEMNT